ncbi:MAG: flagellar biosynthesis protein FliQ [Lachnospiraceae bacterium]|nr:flagellar biosynthesis protein FliQ [Lachnospiraceae bacterium]
MLTEEVVMDIARQAIFRIIVSAAPLLLVSLIIGLVVSIFQTVTSIQEQTLTFVPKIIAVFFAIILFGGWIMNNVVTFSVDLWNNFSVYVG